MDQNPRVESLDPRSTPTAVCEQEKIVSRLMPREPHSELSVTSLGVVLILYVAICVPFILEEPLGRDAWRETMVLSVGRNFCEEGGPLWRPRVDGRESTNGVTGMELPVLPYIQGIAACAGLPQVPVGRLLTLLFALLGIVSMLGLARHLFTEELTARLAWLVFTFSPLIIYYGRSVQPDIPGIALGLLGSLLFFRAMEHEPASLAKLMTSAILMGGAMALKAHTAAFGVGILWTVIVARGWRQIFTRPFIIFGALSLGPPIAWYTYAKHLQEVSGLGSFELGQEVTQGLSYWAGWDKWWSAFVEKPFDIYLFPAVTAFAYGAIIVRGHRLPPWVKGSLIGCLCYFLFMLKHVAHHYYSGMIAVAPLACAGAAGLSHWLGPDSRAKIAPRALLAVVLASTALHGTVRTLGWHAKTEYEAPLARTRDHLNALYPRDERVTLLSRSSPTYFWFLQRKGWRIDWEDPSNLELSRIPTPIAIVDRRRVRGENYSALSHRLEDLGFVPRLENEAAAVWERPR